MPTPFPNFERPNSLQGGGSWTAEFESYDMRRDTAYYYVSLKGGDGVSKEFFVRCHVSGSVHNEERLRAQIARHAEHGEGNTDYAGSMMWHLKRRKARSGS